MMFNRDEIILLVKKIIDGNYSSEQEADEDIEKLTANVADPSAMDYIFQKEYEDLTPEEIADKIIAYQPIRL